MAFFVYTMSQVRIRACTKIRIWRMYIIEPVGEMVYKVYIIEWAQPIFDYTMSQVRIRACTKIRIWRMYIIEPVGEMVYKVYIIEWAQPIFDYTMRDNDVVSSRC